MKFDPNLDPRSAGGVLRWHALRTLQTQSVAEHSWNVLRILLAICPEAHPDVIKEAAFHDCGELVTGDPPATIKRRDPALKEIYRREENTARLAMALPWGLPPPVKLLEGEREILKLADMIEMYEFLLMEELLGNQTLVRNRAMILEWICVALDSMEEDYSVRRRAEDYLIRRASTSAGVADVIPFASRGDRRENSGAAARDLLDTSGGLDPSSADRAG